MGVMAKPHVAKRCDRYKMPSHDRASLGMNESGQMTVEFMVMLPVLLIVAVIAVNVLLFFSECAAFDRLAREAVRIHACSPTYGQSSERSCSQIDQMIKESFEEEYLESSVSVSGSSSGHLTFTSTLVFHPTLFGMGLRSEVLGIALPHFEHSVAYTIDPYKSGVFI